MGKTGSSVELVRGEGFFRVHAEAELKLHNHHRSAVGCSDRKYESIWCVPEQMHTGGRIVSAVGQHGAATSLAEAHLAPKASIERRITAFSEFALW